MILITGLTVQLVIEAIGAKVYCQERITFTPKQRWVFIWLNMGFVPVIVSVLICVGLESKAFKKAPLPFSIVRFGVI
jgi:hypothetical protein